MNLICTGQRHLISKALEHARANLDSVYPLCSGATQLLKSEEDLVLTERISSNELDSTSQQVTAFCPCSRGPNDTDESTALCAQEEATSGRRC